jgi:hypothetical protein
LGETVSACGPILSPAHGKGRAHSHRPELTVSGVTASFHASRHHRRAPLDAPPYTPTSPQPLPPAAAPPNQQGTESYGQTTISSHILPISVQGVYTVGGIDGEEQFGRGEKQRGYMKEQLANSPTTPKHEHPVST